MHLSAGLPDCEGIYERARARLIRDGGVSLTWLVSPEPAAPAADGDWTAILPSSEGGIAPGATELLELVDRWGDKPGDARQLALDALLDDPAYRPRDGGALVASLARRQQRVP
jgi:hypothetical protein